MMRLNCVTPFVGVWIETIFDLSVGMAENVTPFVGVWIETACLLIRRFAMTSHTLRGCVD